MHQTTQPTTAATALATAHTDATALLALLSPDAPQQALGCECGGCWELLLAGPSGQRYRVSVVPLPEEGTAAEEDVSLHPSGCRCERCEADREADQREWDAEQREHLIDGE